MDRDGYQALGEKILNLIKKSAPLAEPIEIFIGEGEQVETEIREGKVESLENSQSLSVSASFAVENRRAGFSSNDLNIETIKRLINNAVNTLPHLGSDPYYILPDEKFLGVANVDLHDEDPDYDSLNVEHLIEEARKLESEGLKQDSRFISNGTYISISKAGRFYLSSAGFSAYRARTVFRKGMGLVINDQAENGLNSGRKQSSGYYTIATHWSDLDDNQKVADESAKRIKMKIGAKKPKTQVAPVIFSPETGRSILGAIESAINGHSLYRESSFLLNKKGEKIGNEKLNIEDNPLLPKTLGSILYDSEGVKAERLDIIQNGILVNYLLDSYSAAKLGTVTNGRKGGGSNFILKPGEISEEELIRSVKNGLYITELSGQGINIITGDFSRGAQGMWIENGELVYPVNEFTINSNLNHMLMNIVDIANNLDWRSSYISPSFLISEMTIAGQ